MKFDRWIFMPFKPHALVQTFHLDNLGHYNDHTVFIIYYIHGIKLKNTNFSPLLGKYQPFWRVTEDPDQINHFTLFFSFFFLIVFPELNICTNAFIISGFFWKTLFFKRIITIIILSWSLKDRWWNTFIICYVEVVSLKLWTCLSIYLNM